MELSIVCSTLGIGKGGGRKNCREGCLWPGRAAKEGAQGLGDLEGTKRGQAGLDSIPGCLEVCITIGYQGSQRIFCFQKNSASPRNNCGVEFSSDPRFWSPATLGSSTISLYFHG